MVAPSRLGRWLAEYASHLVRLHRLIAQGQGDADEADAVRDRMDAPWNKLTEEEIRLIRGLSADLYRIHEPPVENCSKDQAVVEPILASLKQEEWSRALELIRLHEQQLPSAVSSFWRGICYAELGLYSAASEFFGHAARLYPSEPRFWTMWMDSLICERQEAEALGVARQALEHTSAPEVLLKAASIMFLNAEVRTGALSDELHRDAIATSARALEALAGNETKSIELKQEIVRAQLHKAMSLARRGDLVGAREACDMALALSPNNLNAFMVLGFLDEQTRERGDEARVNVIRELVQPTAGRANQAAEAVPF